MLNDYNRMIIFLATICYNMIILYFALIAGASFLLVQTFLFVFNLRHFPSIETDFLQSSTMVSVLIPARNEQEVIRRCVESVIQQKHQIFEILILDDHSTDKTGHILEEIITQYPGVRIRRIIGKDKPPQWIGKNWACHQLSEHARGDIFVFIDADTWMRPTFLNSMLTRFHEFNLDALTVWPQQELGTFWERIVVPQMYYVIYTLLPIKYTYMDPMWLPVKLRSVFRGTFAAACGQCIAIKKKAYENFGGHFSVFDQVVEDVHIAKKLRKNNASFRMFHGYEQFICRMYTSESEIKQGFRKNFLAGFNYNIPFFIFSWLLHLFAYVLPVISLIIGAIIVNYTLITVSIFMLVIPVVIRIRIDSLNKWRYHYSFAHLLGVLWFQRLAFIVIWDKITGKKIVWKDRTVA
jgi:chlorobactene glucosyltransferase